MPAEEENTFKNAKHDYIQIHKNPNKSAKSDKMIQQS